MGSCIVRRRGGRSFEGGMEGGRRQGLKGGGVVYSALSSPM